MSSFAHPLLSHRFESERHSVAQTSTQDETLYCENCGISFLWTGEEQRRAREMNAHALDSGQDNQEADDHLRPTRCPGCCRLLPAAGYERGEVKWFNARKRYGFIVRANQPDIFVHRSALKGSGNLRTGDFVEFTVAETDEKLAAKDVKVLMRAQRNSPK
jgi:cold shock CspA family protein